MKLSLVLVILMSAYQSFSSEMTCSDAKGCISFDSKVKVGDRVAIVNPQLKINNKVAEIIGSEGTEASKIEFGNGICRFLGYKSGIVTYVQPLTANEGHSILVATLRNEGELTHLFSLKTSEGYVDAAKVVICFLK